MTNMLGARVAILEARMSTEMTRLLSRAGAVTHAVPAVRETPVDSIDAVADFIDDLARGSIEVVVFLTGAGVRALVGEADRLGREAELLGALASCTIVCRGPKPVSALRRLKVGIHVVAPEPHTTRELVAAMAALSVDGAGVAVVHYGERNAVLSAVLEGRGAKLTELCLYEWQLPESLGPLRGLVGQIIDGELDAVAFTSQIQVRHLFRVADELGRSGELVSALNGRTVVASIGPTCSGVLEEFGVRPVIVPEHPKMGHLVLALAAHLRRTQGSWLGGVRAAR